MIRIAVVEDDPVYSRELCGLLRRYAGEHDLQFTIREYRDGKHIVFDTEAIHDLIFMDVEMPGQDGISAAEELRRRGSDAQILFVTNMAQYALQGYRVHPWAYLLKPVNYVALSMELQGVLKLVQRDKGASVMLNTREGARKVFLRDVLYVESLAHDIFFHTREETIRVRDTLSSLEAALLPHGFCRSNRSYLVNLREVSGIRGEEVLVGKERLPLSRQRRKEFLEALNADLGG